MIVSGGTVRRSVLSPNVRIHSGAEVDGSVVMDATSIGAGAVVRNTILDKNVVVPPGARVGVDPEEDAARGFTVSAGGVTVVGKNERVPG
jgi:glucose-1-phosphate adenylyltransferase